MKIAVHSDLHSERNPEVLPELQGADLLILAGDIGDADSLPPFFAALRRHYPQLPTLYVLGNHEFHHREYFEAKARYRTLAADFDVRLLDNEAVQFGALLIAGTVLWSNFLAAGCAEDSMRWAGATLPDFLEVSYGSRPFTPQDMLAEHARATQFLDGVLQQPAAHKLVISHFLPSTALVHPKRQHSPEARMKSAYWASELPELYSRADTWIFGHSHDNVVKTVRGCRFISNQRGSGRRPARGYCRNFFYTLEDTP